MIYDIFTDGTLVNSLIIGLVISYFVAFALMFYLRKKRHTNNTLEQRIKKYHNVFEILTERLKLGRLNEEVDAVSTFNSQNFSALEYSVTQMLDDFYAYLVLQASKEPDDHNHPISRLIQEKGHIVEQLIKLGSREKPFSELPEQERFILKSINNSAETVQCQSIIDDLNDLNRILVSKNRSLRTATIINWISVSLAILGLVASVIFGVGGRIDYYRIQENAREVFIEEYRNNEHSDLTSPFDKEMPDNHRQESTVGR